ncbi:MAG: ACP S-malonyltransferase [Planctomycetota bacterium]
MSVAFVFPGQGAQIVGMGKSVFGRSAAARGLFERARAVLGFDLAKICFEGPAEALESTDVCQPALLVTALACLEDVPAPVKAKASVAAGLSLGEYTALVFAGAMEFEAAVDIVRKRGRYMIEASKAVSGGLVALVGADESAARALCAEAAKGRVLVVANLNAPGQVVVAGENAALGDLVALAKTKGIKRAMPLKVSGAFHSPLMKPAAENLERALAGVVIRAPRFPVVSNVDAEPSADPGVLRAKLARQIVEPVLWEKCVRRMMADGVTEFHEVGPGKTLAGMIKRIDPNVNVVNAGGDAGVGGEEK